MTGEGPSRGWARLGVAAGASVSVAANVLSTFIHPAGAGPQWSPPAGAVVGAVWWPVSLFLALEVLASGRWGESGRWLALRLSAVAPVAAVAAVVSYEHLSMLLASWDEGAFAVRFGPVAVDGLMVVSSAALYRARTIRLTVRTVSADGASGLPDAADDLRLHVVPDGSGDRPDAAADGSAGRSVNGPRVRSPDRPQGRPDGFGEPSADAVRGARRTVRRTASGRSPVTPSASPDRTLPDWRTSDWSAVAQARGIGRTQAFTVVREEGPDAVREARRTLSADDPGARELPSRAVQNGHREPAGTR